jgi:hypothetical protein
MKIDAPHLLHHLGGLKEEERRVNRHDLESMHAY